MRSYALSRTPRVVELAGADAVDALHAAVELTEVLERALGGAVPVEVIGDDLLLPPPHEVRCDGRVLRGGEYETYAQACVVAASRMSARAIRFDVEEMYVFDWDAFKKHHWVSLQSAYQALPGWLATNDLPRWFGHDERKGPCLWASVEPPGLQVDGILDLARFDDWHRRFVEMTLELPVRSLT